MLISKDNLMKCLSNDLGIKSIPPKLLKKKLLTTVVCPQCDAYALGLDMTEGISIQDKNGNMLTVHDLPLFE